jgi:signal transduction histidine kinase
VRRAENPARLVVPALAAGAVQLGGSIGAAVHQPAARPLDPLAVVLLLIGPIALLARRRMPVAALVINCLVVLLYLGIGYPFGPVVLALVIALVNAVLRDHRPAAWGVAAAGYVGLATIGWVRYGTPGWLPLSAAAAWLLVVLTAAELGRARLERRQRERRARADAARRLATEERLRIARELHDVLAHHVSLINVQAGTALHLLDSQPGVARDALTAIKASSKEVLVELRGMLGMLRGVDEQPPRAPTAGLAGLDELVERIRSVGIAVEVQRVGIPRPLPASVDTAAFRIAQEALTNVHRHSGAVHATVSLTYTADRVTVQVDDDGHGSARQAGTGTGSGLVGMRERVTALGGQFNAADRPEGGFRVRAELPGSPLGPAGPR